MNWIQRAILGKSLVNQLSEFAEIKALSVALPRQIPTKYAILNGRIVTPTDNKKTYIEEGYNKNDIIYSVINLILDKIVLPEWGLYKIVDESSLKKYHSLMERKNISGRDYKTAMKYKSEAVEPLTSFSIQQGKLKELFKYANECDTFQDHNRSLFLYKLLVGDYFEWGDMLTMGANKGIPQSLWSLPAQFMNIKINDEFPVRPSSYELTVWNQQFEKETILHEKYVNPNWDINGQQLYGFAPLRAFLKNINRNNAAKDASYAKYLNGGVEEIVYLDDMDIDATVKEQQLIALKQRLSEKEYRGPDAQGKFAISGYKTGSTRLGNTPVELGIIDSEKWDAIMFCNGYGVPPELLGLTQKTYNNVKEAEKALTTRSAIPLLTSRRNSLNRKLQTDWGFKGVNIYVDYDTECYTELQTDAKEAMEAISMLTMRTPNEEREAINWETRPETEADEVWVKTATGMQPLSDYQASAVDEALMRSQTINSMNDAGNNTDNGQAGNNGSANGKGGKKNVSYTKGLLS